MYHSLNTAYILTYNFNTAMIELIITLQLAVSCLGNSRDKQILSLCSTKRYKQHHDEVMNSKIKFYDDDSSSSDEDGLDP